MIERYSLLKALRRDLLALSKETDVYYTGLGVAKEELETNDFNVGDFEFYLTDKTNVEGKYCVSAFWNKTDIESGMNRLNRWRTFINTKAESVIEKAD